MCPTASAASCSGETASHRPAEAELAVSLSQEQRAHILHFMVEYVLFFPHFVH